MLNQLSRLLVLLRKENNLSQKKAADALGVSQALLSHYEKGIRECGLDFLIKVADFYNVSVDYLLGRTADRQGAIITAHDLPDENAAGKENVMKGSILPTLNKRLIFNSMNILFDLLQKTNDKALINEISSLIMLSVYKSFRYIYTLNENNPTSLFAADNTQFSFLANSAESIAEMNISCKVSDNKSKTNMDFSLNQQELERLYPQFSSSLLNLIQNCEIKMNVRKK